ncbi:hypothetical protein QBC35DRAFT_392405 [Podospora australis]|uniref:Uncharacterized protein n=1 Tax=Podospora australis TaxID=1536484 RepID=A0AAN6WLF7_9PEZI|nr:hypothetical protein QBC35DRAFT_392405 [Podospora australis]
MDRCWFILPHHDVQPPRISPTGIGALAGGLCPGHIIPSPSSTDLDSVLNAAGPLPIHPDMHIHETTAMNFTWSRKRGRSYFQAMGGGVPILAAGGVTAEAHAGVAFEKSRTRDLRPTRVYLEDLLEDPAIQDWIEKKKLLGSWELYMITGVKVAKGGKVTVRDGKLQRGFSGFAEAHNNTGVSRETQTGSSQESMSDFVWAVRLEKITKGIFDRTRSKSRYYSKGAAFGLPQAGQLGIDDVLTEVGIDAEQVDLLEGEKYAVCIKAQQAPGAFDDSVD